MRRALAVLVVFLRLCSTAFAQTGSVGGTVVDQTGGVIPGATVTLTGQSGRQSTTTGATGQYRFGAVGAGTYEISVLMPGFAPVTRNNVVVANDPVTVPALTLAVAGMGEAVVVSASKVESALIDAPATMTVLSGSTLAALPAQNYGDVLRSVPGLNVIQLSARDVNVTSRQATQHAGDVAADAARRPLDLPRLLRPHSLGLRADEPDRHQADRSGPRSRVGRLGRERAHRRRQHHHQVAARDGGHDQRDVQRGVFRSRRRFDGGQGRGRDVRRRRHHLAGAERALVVSSQCRILQLRSLPAAGRKDSGHRRSARSDRQEHGRRRVVIRPMRRRASGRAFRTAARASRSSTCASIRS